MKKLFLLMVALLYITFAGVSQNYPKCNAYFYVFKDSTVSSSMFAYRFINKSTGAEHSYYMWDFGDGTTSYEQNPMHKYLNEGYYGVCLKMYSFSDNYADTCVSTYCDTLKVMGYEPPQGCFASFGYSKIDSIITIPEAVPIQFYDQSRTSNGNILSWQWDFGDGSVSNIQNPQHSFYFLGTYNVCMTIVSALVDNTTCTNSFCQTIQLGYDNKCNANFYSIEDSVGLGHYTFFPEMTGANFKYFWDFGDNTSDTGSNPSHKYSQTGIYNVCLTVYNEILGCKDYTCQQLFVNNEQQGCFAYFNMFMETDPNNLNTCFFSDASKGNIKYWYWDFGDGNTSNEQNPTYTYIKEGEYNVCLSVSSLDSSDWCSNTYCQTIYIGGASKFCRANYYNYLDTMINTPNYFHFIDISEGNPNQWYWDFGDGTISDKKNPDHQYLKDGIYNVCLTISNDSLNCKDTYCNSVYVGQINYDCKTDFGWEIDSTVVSFPETAIYRFYPYDTQNAVQFSWDFGDGYTSYEKTPVHSFYPGSDYNICLTTVYSNPDGQLCKAFSCKMLYVDSTIYPPVPDKCYNYFTYKINQITDKDITINFDAYTNYPDNTTYIWSFGDITETTQTPFIKHNFTQSGDIKVCLTTNVIIDSLECSYTSCQSLLGWETDSTNYWGAISGKVLAGNDYADKGYVAIIKMDNFPYGYMSYFDVAQIGEKGYYHFDNIPFGSYYVFASLYKESQYFDKYLTTFYGDSWQWNLAKPVGVGDFVATDNVNINLVKLNSYPKGKGSISGFVSDFKKSSKGIGIADIQIVLLDMNDKVLNFTRTDKSGSYGFSELAYGTYKVYVESIGVITTPAEVTIDENNENPDGINFSIDNFKAMPVDNMVGITNITKDINIGNIYPNPVDNTANINISLPAVTNIKIEIYNRTGQLISIENIKQSAGDHIISINTANLTHGLYYIRLITDNSAISTKKFIK
ncbi:MAG: PKD domain-containing protein [Bacteroidales bacterium]|nr:PKD domain-containing protein [Bacteroidales bacterium]